MNEKIALTSNGPLSGKTAFARYVRDTFSYIIIPFGDQLKEEFIAQRHKDLTLEYLLEHKEQFRGELQEFGYQVGYNNAPKAGYWIERALAIWNPDNNPRVVFDGVRVVEQANYLRDAGFVLVRLSISEQVRDKRARELGRDVEALHKAMREHPELESPYFPVDFTLYGDMSWERNAKILRLER